MKKTIGLLLVLTAMYSVGMYVDQKHNDPLEDIALMFNSQPCFDDASLDGVKGLFNTLDSNQWQKIASKLCGNKQSPVVLNLGHSNEQVQVQESGKKYSLPVMFVAASRKPGARVDLQAVGKQLEALWNEYEVKDDTETAVLYSRAGGLDIRVLALGKFWDKKVINVKESDLKVLQDKSKYFKSVATMGQLDTLDDDDSIPALSRGASSPDVVEPSTVLERHVNSMTVSSSSPFPQSQSLSMRESSV